METGRRGTEINNPLKVIHSNRRHHDLLNASEACACYDRRTVSLKIREVEMAVGINQHKSSMAQA